MYIMNIAQKWKKGEWQKLLIDSLVCILDPFKPQFYGQFYLWMGYIIALSRCDTRSVLLHL